MTNTMKALITAQKGGMPIEDLESKLLFNIFIHTSIEIPSLLIIFRVQFYFILFIYTDDLNFQTKSVYNINLLSVWNFQIKLNSSRPFIQNFADKYLLGILVIGCK